MQIEFVPRVVIGEMVLIFVCSWILFWFHLGHPSVLPIVLVPGSLFHVAEFVHMFNSVLVPIVFMFMSVPMFRSVLVPIVFMFMSV